MAEDRRLVHLDELERKAKLFVEGHLDADIDLEMAKEYCQELRAMEKRELIRVCEGEALGTDSVTDMARYFLRCVRGGQQFWREGSL